MIVDSRAGLVLTAHDLRLGRGCCRRWLALVAYLGPVFRRVRLSEYVAVVFVSAVLGDADDPRSLR